MQQRRATTAVVAELLTGLAHEIADVLADRLRPAESPDLPGVVDRLERLLQASQVSLRTYSPELLGEADRRWGFPFAVDGAVGTPEARELLGGCSERTLNRHVIAGKIRRGKDGKRAVYCRRSILRYVAGLEE